MSDERLIGLDISLAPRINPKLIRKLRVSLTTQEWECLYDVIGKAMEDQDFYRRLCEEPLEVLEEYKISDEAIKGLEEIMHEFNKPFLSHGEVGTW